MVANPFSGPAVAARYARARPALHHHVVELLLARGNTIDRALDIGCGTGLSTRPLTSIARTVVGVDASKDMLRPADRTERIAYVLSTAERLPFTEERSSSSRCARLSTGSSPLR